MPMFDYKCNECEFTEEYCVSPSVPKEMGPPEKCPKCGKGILEKIFNPKSVSFDVIGGYDQTYGKKAWKRNMSLDDQSKVLAGKKDPY